ncbi:hypothetical protein E2C01_024360 [Portunus trituberculatus]|uniref:Uncharacterized protein n=1 Tax=Portunus trituberculatus TaxID=210409 RepID=A0A5B7EDM0_PORTR|nr:hypothetical protein [Portunus trituberculatus]
MKAHPNSHDGSALSGHHTDGPWKQQTGRGGGSLHSIWGSPANTRSGPTVLNFIDLRGGVVLPPRQAVARSWGHHYPCYRPLLQGRGARRDTPAFH